jgi:hypothetical protein
LPSSGGKRKKKEIKERKKVVNVNESGDEGRNGKREREREKT